MKRFSEMDYEEKVATLKTREQCSRWKLPQFNSLLTPEGLEELLQQMDVDLHLPSEHLPRGKVCMDRYSHIVQLEYAQKFIKEIYGFQAFELTELLFGKSKEKKNLTCTEIVERFFLGTGDHNVIVTRRTIVGRKDSQNLVTDWLYDKPYVPFAATI
jgi:hypothetical protein